MASSKIPGDINSPSHPYYQRRYNVPLAKEFECRGWFMQDTPFAPGMPNVPGGDPVDVQVYVVKSYDVVSPDTPHGARIRMYAVKSYTVVEGTP